MTNKETAEDALRLLEAADFIESVSPDAPHPLVQWLREAAARADGVIASDGSQS